MAISLIKNDWITHHKVIIAVVRTTKHRLQVTKSVMSPGVVG